MAEDKIGRQSLSTDSVTTHWPLKKVPTDTQATKGRVATLPLAHREPAII